MPKYINADELQEICEKRRYPSIPIDVFKSQPPADVRENIHGEWINKRTMQHDGEFYCSVCDFVLDSFMQGVFYNYCPNCGADMRERKETE